MTKTSAPRPLVAGNWKMNGLANALAEADKLKLRLADPAVGGKCEVMLCPPATLVGAMAEKAEATSRRIGHFVTELERQVSWVTRASVSTLDQRRADYALLLRQQSAVSQLSHIDGDGREQLRLSRQEAVAGSGTDFSRDPRFTQTSAKGVWYGPAYFRNDRPYMPIAVAHSGFGPAGKIRRPIRFNSGAHRSTASSGPPGTTPSCPAAARSGRPRTGAATSV